MHELGIAQEVVAMVAERADGAKVTRVVMQVGKLALVLPDSLQFCFGLCAQGTPLEGAELIIQEMPGRARCRACGSELTLDRPFGRCSCGGSELEWLSGEELLLKEFEVLPCA